MNSLSRKFNVYVANTVTAPNGIIYDSFDGITPRLVFCNWSSNAAIKKINIADSTMSTLTTTTLSNCDGICKGKNGKFYVSSWGNQTIQRFDSTFTGGSTAVVTGLSNPADIFYNLNSDTLAIPNASNNTVSFHYLGVANFLSEKTRAASFQIFPNPSTGIFRIESLNDGLQKISIYNELMQAIQVHEISNTKHFEIKLDAVRSGFYFIRLNNEPLQKLFVY